MTVTLNEFDDEGWESERVKIAHGRLVRGAEYSMISVQRFDNLIVHRFSWLTLSGTIWLLAV